MTAVASSPIDNFKEVVTTKYADFNGRARRAEYWWFAAATFGIQIGLYILVLIVAQINSTLALVPILLLLVVSLGLLIPSIAITVRRLHDTGKSGWWYFITFIPLLGAIILLVFTCTDSDQGVNDYGPSPKYNN